MYEDIKRILGNLRARHYDTDEIIFRIGDVSEEFYFLKSGLSITVATTQDGHERAVMATWPGRTFGTASFCCRSHRRTTAIAAKPCEVVGINWNTYRSLLSLYPNMSQFIAAELALDTQELFDQILEGSVLDSDSKVARYIMRRIDRNQCSIEDGLYSLEFTQDLIGRILGISRWSVNQSLMRFRKAGWVTTSYGNITILDPVSLKAFANPE